MCKVNLHEDYKKFSSYEMFLMQAEIPVHTITKDFENPLNENYILLYSCSITCTLKNMASNYSQIFTRQKNL